MKTIVSNQVLINCTGCFKNLCPFWNIDGKKLKDVKVGDSTVFVL